MSAQQTKQVVPPIRLQKRQVTTAQDTPESPSWSIQPNTRPVSLSATKDHSIQAKDIVLPTTSKAPRTSSVKSPESGLKSEIWKHFVLLPDGKKKCKQCDQSYGALTSTGTMRQHMYNVHQIKVGGVTPKKSQPPKGDRCTMLKEAKKRLDDMLVTWIVDDFQSFRVVQGPAFRRLLGNI